MKNTNKDKRPRNKGGPIDSKGKKQRKKKTFFWPLSLHRYLGLCD